LLMVEQVHIRNFIAFNFHLKIQIKFSFDLLF
jgi:hypothetical protein